ncbi:MAG: hypothetical protein ACLRSW_09695 [Christensenellaceae bacterium]
MISQTEEAESGAGFFAFFELYLKYKHGCFAGKSLFYPYSKKLRTGIFSYENKGGTRSEKHMVKREKLSKTVAYLSIV